MNFSVSMSVFTTFENASNFGKRKKIIAFTELAFFRDIPSHGKNPDPGDKNPEIKKIPESRGLKSRASKNPESLGIKSRDFKNPESGGFVKNFGDFYKIPKKSQRSPGFRNFRDFSIFPKIKNPDPKKSHPEINSGCVIKKVFK